MRTHTHAHTYYEQTCPCTSAFMAPHVRQQSMLSMRLCAGGPAARHTHTHQIPSCNRCNPGAGFNFGHRSASPVGCEKKDINWRPVQLCGGGVDHGIICAEHVRIGQRREDTVINWFVRSRRPAIKCDVIDLGDTRLTASETPTSLLDEHRRRPSTTPPPHRNQNQTASLGDSSTNKKSNRQRYLITENDIDIVPNFVNFVRAHCATDMLL